MVCSFVKRVRGLMRLGYKEEDKAHAVLWMRGKPKGQGMVGAWLLCAWARMGSLACRALRLHGSAEGCVARCVGA